MRRVVRNAQQMTNLADEIVGWMNARAPDEENAVMVEYKPYKPPRTMKQSRKIHAMFGDIGQFTGDSNIKGWVKSLSFWPTEYKEHAGQGQVVPKSEAHLTKAEEIIVIEHLYLIGAELPGFQWGDD